MKPLIKVTSPSFSKNPVLAAELAALPVRPVLNTAGKRYRGKTLVEYLANADGAIVGLEKITADVLDRCPRLKIVAKYGVGLDNLDRDACRDRGIAVGWTPGVNKRSVAEMVVGQMIGLSRNLFTHSRLLASGDWHKDGGRQFSDMTVGIVGLGHIGRELARLLQPFGCRLLGNDILDRAAFARKHRVQLVAKEELFFRSDIVTLHVPLTAATAHLINARTLRLMQPEAFLVNTSRGGVVDQQALKAALRKGRLAGAAIDVYEEEPPTDRSLLGLPNLICTPHIAGNAAEAVTAMGRSALRHLERFYNPPAERAPAKRRAALAATH